MAGPPVHLLRDRATQSRLVSTKANEGYREVPTEIATNVRCRFAPKMGTGLADDMRAGHLIYENPHVMYFHPDQDVKRDDIFVLTTRNGRTVHVTAFDEASERGVYLKALVREDQEGV